MDFANVNSPIPDFRTDIVPDLHSFTLQGIYDSPKSVLSGDSLYVKVRSCTIFPHFYLEFYFYILGLKNLIFFGQSLEIPTIVVP